MNTDRYFGRRYSAQYDCLAFLKDVWRDLTGDDLAHKLNHAFGLVCGQRTISRGAFKVFEKLDKPEEPCIVLMLGSNRRAHVGLWLRGRVLHLCSTGVEHVDLDVASRTFKHVRFVKCKNN